MKILLTYEHNCNEVTSRLLPTRKSNAITLIFIIHRSLLSKLYYVLNLDE